LIELFIIHQSEIYSNPQTAVLHEQANEDYHKLENASKQLNEFETRAGIVSIDQELALLIQQRGDISGYMSHRPVELVPKNPNSNNRARSGGLGILPVRFPTLDDVQRKIDDLRAHEVSLAQTYRPDSEVGCS